MPAKGNLKFASSKQRAPRISKKTAAQIKRTIRSANVKFNTEGAHGEYNPIRGISEYGFIGPQNLEAAPEDYFGFTGPRIGAPDFLTGGPESYVGSVPFSGISEFGLGYPSSGIIDPSYDSNQPGTTFDSNARDQYTKSGARKSDIRRAAQRPNPNSNTWGRTGPFHFKLSDISLPGEIEATVVRDQSYAGHAGGYDGIRNRIFGANQESGWRFEPFYVDNAEDNVSLFNPRNNAPKVAEVNEQSGGLFSRPKVTSNPIPALGGLHAGPTIRNNLVDPKPRPDMFASAVEPEIQGPVHVDPQNSETLAKQTVMQPNSKPLITGNRSNPGNRKLYKRRPVYYSKRYAADFDPFEDKAVKFPKFSHGTAPGAGPTLFVSRLSPSFHPGRSPPLLRPGTSSKQGVSTSGRVSLRHLHQEAGSIYAQEDDNDNYMAPEFIVPLSHQGPANIRGLSKRAKLRNKRQADVTIVSKLRKK